MTHSHDRTLLASLSFGDPDKREPLHDLACEYLAEPIQSQRLVRFATTFKGDVSTVSKSEVVISKGEGRYRSTIGFLDLMIEWEENATVPKDEHGWATRSLARGIVVVEVKINPIGIGDLLRQIGLYREYVGGNPTPSERLRFLETGEQVGQLSWVLATAYALDAGQMDTLRQSCVHCVRLGDGFTKWFEERQKRPAPKLEEF
jgi:hypothetical protein